jgi:hypothetical protein
MSKLLKVTLLLALAVGMFGAYRHIAAQETEASKARSPIPLPTFDVEVSQDPNVVALNHVLYRTYINNGSYGPATVAASSLTPIDKQLTVQCPGTSGSGTCTIQADMWISNGGRTTTDNSNFICLYVDGSPVNTCGFLTGETPSDSAGSFTTTTTSQIATGLAPGNHTVRTYFFSDDGCDVSYYNSNYRVYKP